MLGTEDPLGCCAGAGVGSHFSRDEVQEEGAMSAKARQPGGDKWHPCVLGVWRARWGLRGDRGAGSALRAHHTRALVYGEGHHVAFLVPPSEETHSLPRVILRECCHLRSATSSVPVVRAEPPGSARLCPLGQEELSSGCPCRFTTEGLLGVSSYK